MSNKTNEKFTCVNVYLGEEGNELLNSASKQHKRTKRKEAAIRLEHHLKVFGSDWTAKTTNAS